MRLFVWLALGLVIYFAYGRQHSVMARRTRRARPPSDRRSSPGRRDDSTFSPREERGPKGRMRVTGPGVGPPGVPGRLERRQPPPMRPFGATGRPRREVEERTTLSACEPRPSADRGANVVPGYGMSAALGG